jgi:hypothetical protein
MMDGGDEARSLPHDRANKGGDSVVPGASRREVLKEDRMQEIWRIMKWSRCIGKSAMVDG